MNENRFTGLPKNVIILEESGTLSIFKRISTIESIFSYLFISLYFLISIAFFSYCLFVFKLWFFIIIAPIVLAGFYKFAKLFLLDVKLVISENGYATYTSKLFYFKKEILFSKNEYTFSWSTLTGDDSDYIIFVLKDIMNKKESAYRRFLKTVF